MQVRTTTTTTALQVHLSAVAAEFLADGLARQRSPRTMREHGRVLRVLAAWLDDAGLSWDTARPAQLAAFIRRRAAPAPAATVGEICTLRVFYAWAVEAEFLTSSPATGRAFQTPKRGKPYPRALAAEQVRALLDHLCRRAQDGPRQHRDYAMITTAAYTGLRAAELAALVWADVSVAEQAIVVVAGKGNKGRRVKLHAGLIPILQSWQDRQHHAGVGAVFAVEKTSAILPNQVGRAVRRYAALLGLPLTTHALRHTFATQSVRRSRNVRSVSRALGHSDLRHTERYLAPALEDGNDAVDSLPGVDGW